MATYAEISQLYSNDALRNKVTVAAQIVALELITEDVATPNHDARVTMATRILSDPIGWGEKMFRASLASNAAATVSQITGASDEALKSAVQSVVNAFATNL